MGISVREKIKGTNDYWIFVRYAGARAAQRIGDKQIAESIKAEIQKEIRTGRFSIASMKAARAPEVKTEKPAVPTVAEYYDKIFVPVYLESAVARSTAASYRNNFKMHINPALGPLRLDEIDHEDMEVFVSGLVKKGLAKATIQTIIKDLCTLFNHAKKRKELKKLVTDNPATGLTRLYSQAKAKHEKIEPLTHGEVPLFLNAVLNRRDSARHYAWFFMAIHAGLRPEELAGAQRGDIDFNGKYIEVQRAIDRVHRKVVPTKTKRIRRVELSDELIEVLKEHLRKQREYWMAQGKPQPDWLFPNEEGGWNDYANLANRHFHPCMEKAGLHRRRQYDLRHSFASLLLTAGAPIAYVSEQMGHASIQITVDVYGHLQPGANRHWLQTLPGLAVATSGNLRLEMKKAAGDGGQLTDSKSGTRDSNPRLQPWQGCTLPLS